MTTRATVYVWIPQEKDSTNGLRTHLENGFGKHLDSIVSAEQIPSTGKRLDNGREPAQCRYDKQSGTECYVGILNPFDDTLPSEVRDAYHRLSADIRPNAVVVFAQPPRKAVTIGFYATTCAAETLDYAAKQGWPAVALDEFIKMRGKSGIFDNFDRVSVGDAE